jgi:AcrR family transcriptional regulator
MTQPAPGSAPPSATRPRDSAATRQALLDAARELFATVGYDATTVRAVSDRAGVNQALLFRYFGNKEGLFAAAVLDKALELLAEGPADDLLERILTEMLADEADRGPEPLMAMLLAAGSTQVAEEVREKLGSAYAQAFATLIDTDDPDDARARADLLLAWLLGISLMRGALRSGPLHDRDVLTHHVLRTAEVLLGPRRRRD